jgi:hypothetical protein
MVVGDDDSGALARVAREMIRPALTEATSPFFRPIKYSLLLETILSGFGGATPAGTRCNSWTSGSVILAWN